MKYQFRFSGFFNLPTLFFCQLLIPIQSNCLDQSKCYFLERLSIEQKGDSGKPEIALWSDLFSLLYMLKWTLNNTFIVKCKNKFLIMWHFLLISFFILRPLKRTLHSLLPPFQLLLTLLFCHLWGELTADLPIAFYFGGVFPSPLTIYSKIRNSIKAKGMKQNWFRFL